MPLITNKRGNANRDILYYHVGVAYASGEVYALPEENKRLEVRNMSANTLTVTVNSTQYTIEPFKSKLITDDYTQFTISANVNSSAFEVSSFVDKEDDSSSELDSLRASLNDIAYNVKSFGAKGDGVTDDTLAIQNAINELGTKKKILYFPEGTYIFSNTISIPTNCIMQGSGWNTILKYTGTSDAIKMPNSSYSGIVLKDFKLLGTSSALYGIKMINSNITNVEINNINIEGFKNANGGGIYADNAYKVTISNCLIKDCYDGIYLGAICINNEIYKCFIRGWTRYGVAIIGTSTNGCYKNNIHDCIIDEPVGNTGTSGIYSSYNNASTFDGNHFELLSEAINLGNGFRNAVQNNLFSQGLTTALNISSAGCADTLVMNNRSMSGAYIDNGNRTKFVFSDLAGVSDVGGYNNSRVGIKDVSGYIGVLGGGIDLENKMLKNSVRVDTINSITVSTSILTNITSHVLKLSAASAQPLFGVSGLQQGQRLTIVFSDSNITLYHGRSGDTGSYFRLQGAVNYTPKANDCFEFIKLTDGSLLEINRHLI